MSQLTCMRGLKDKRWFADGVTVGVATYMYAWIERFANDAEKK